MIETMNDVAITVMPDRKAQAAYNKMLPIFNQLYRCISAGLRRDCCAVKPSADHRSNAN